MDVISKVDTSMFYDGSVKECLADLALKGCRLYARADTVFAMNEGVPYSLQLSFGRTGALTDISLNYRREGDVTGSQCRDVFGRTLDWGWKLYGPFVELKNKAGKGWQSFAAQTEEGHNFSYGKDENDASFVTSFMVSQASKVDVRPTADGATRHFLDRNVTVFGSYILVDGKPFCMIGLAVAEPDKIARADAETSAEVDGSAHTDQTDYER